MTDEFDDVLIQLEALRSAPDRSEVAARSGLQAFLDEVTRLHPAVSGQPPRRLTGWMSKFTQERSPMFVLAIKLVLVLAVMLGGAGVTAAAAQSSLPNEALYPIKLLAEEAQLALAASPDAQIDAQLDHAQQRVSEMAQLNDRGAAIPADVPTRLQAQLQAALHIAAQLDDQHLPAALDRIQLRTQDQLREVEQLHLNDAMQALTQAREMAQLGRSDPQAFRAHFGPSRPADAPPPMTPRADPSRTPAGPRASSTPQPSRTPQATCTPQLTNTPQNTAQPVATPVGQGDGHEYGPGPQVTSIPGGGGEAQGSQDGLGGNGPGADALPKPGGSDNGGGDNGGSNNGGSDNGGDNSSSGGSGRP
jgi:hypothetical protein